MKKMLSVVGFFALIVALGLLAGTALNGPDGTSEAAAVSDVTSIVPGQAGDGEVEAALAPEAVTAASKYSSFAIPLQLTGISMASHVANYAETGDPNTNGSGILRVLMWNGTRFLEYCPDAPIFCDPDYAVGVGDSLMVLADNTLTATILSWVGDVPAQGAVTNSLAANANNVIMVPLDQYATFGNPGAPVLTGTADKLAKEIDPPNGANVNRVLMWDASNQRYVEYCPAAPIFCDPDFQVYSGYPYMILTGGSPPSHWP